MCGWRCRARVWHTRPVPEIALPLVSLVTWGDSLQHHTADGSARVHHYGPALKHRPSPPLKLNTLHQCAERALLPCAQIFGEVSELVQSALDGYHVCLFSYGQTGAGKTYTMQVRAAHQPARRPLC
mgnify:CR=1 FL=1